MTVSDPPRPLGATAYLAADGFTNDLIEELGDVRAVHGRLVIADGPARPAAWAANIWFDPVLIDAPSIGEGARALRAIQRNWALYSFAHHRRAALIEAKLPPVRFKPLPFPSEPPKAPLGSWSLLESNTILAAPRCSSPFRHGEVEFIENKTVPPNRAYLKLWELFTLLGVRPGPSDLCLDLGASPGGWTWVLHETGARVVAVDKAPLAPAIAALPRVTARTESAFGLDPAAIGHVDWLFSDVICYPQRLLNLVQRWFAAGTCRRLVCTIKFQGETDHETARAFAAIPGSRLLHLHHNKHELTWVKL
ncbi:MAG TPA: SAM-dependent methyltransferase [Alphaproteobacteria bacterium]|nr:SAM-dependent methyltransferase [Alphaproteobacteria bacterium]